MKTENFQVTLKSKKSAGMPLSNFLFFVWLEISLYRMNMEERF